MHILLSVGYCWYQQAGCPGFDICSLVALAANFQKAPSHLHVCDFHLEKFRLQSKKIDRLMYDDSMVTKRLTWNWLLTLCPHSIPHWCSRFSSWAWCHRRIHLLPGGGTGIAYLKGIRHSHQIFKQCAVLAIYSGENKYLTPCRFRKFGHLQRNVWSINVMVGLF